MQFSVNWLRCTVNAYTTNDCSMVGNSMVGTFGTFGTFGRTR